MSTARSRSGSLGIAVALCALLYLIYRSPRPSARATSSTPGSARELEAPARGRRRGRLGRLAYSHSIVAGGFDETSSATRLTPRTSLMIRFETRSSRS